MGKENVGDGRYRQLVKSFALKDSRKMLRGFPGGSDGKESACNSGGMGSVVGLEDPLEKGMVTHSRILAWRIPWIKEPAGLQSMGLQRVRHN